VSRAQKIVVVGSGFAGLAALSTLVEAGVSPVLVAGRGGASALTAGAFDFYPWTTPEARHFSLSSLTATASGRWALAFLKGLSLASDRSGWVVTGLGVVRPALLVGTGILAVSAHLGQVIGVLGVGRSDFAAEALARSWQSSLDHLGDGTRFRAIVGNGLLSQQEQDYPLPALGRALSDEARRARFLSDLERICRGHPDLGALIIGPWLVECEGLGALPVPVGEILSPPEGTFPQRFMRARAEYLRSLKIEILESPASRVHDDAEQVHLEFGQESGLKDLVADGVVLATGGLLGGGVALRSEGDFPAELTSALHAGARSLGGGVDGWDGAEDGGAWVMPPHFRKNLPDSSRIVVAGDARPADLGEATGTALGAVTSGHEAALRLLTHLNLS
jgi:glycine/D-amino acid oxidase-like deaminating enzyme